MSYVSLPETIARRRALRPAGLPSVSRPGVRSFSAAAAIQVEILTPAAYLALEDGVRGLTARAIEQNIFAEPAFVHALALAEGEEKTFRIAVAFDGARAKRPVIGALPYLIAPARPWRPLPAAETRLHGDMASCHPLLEASDPSAVFSAIAQAIAMGPGMPLVLNLSMINANGATMRALSSVAGLSERLQQVGTFERATYQRQAAITRDDPAASLAETLTLRRFSSSEIHEAFEDFLVMEGASWKGRAGKAIICDPLHTTFMRDAVRQLAARGQAELVGLEKAGRLTAMALLLRSGGTMWLHKIVHDEAHAHLSAGRDIARGIARLAVDDRTIAIADSCAPLARGAMDDFWPMRRRVSDLSLDLGAGVAFGLSIQAERARRRANAFFNRHRARYDG